VARAREVAPRIVAALVLCAIGAMAGSAGAAGGPADVAYLASTDGLWQAWVMRADGSAARQVTRSEREKSRVSWFPDGRALLVSALDGSLVRVDLETGEETSIALRLPNVIDAVLSPDGTSVAFSASAAGGRDASEIWTMSVDGSGLRKHTAMPWLQHEPAFDPGGEWIYFVSGDGGDAHDVWRVSRRTQSREQLTAGNLYHFDVCVAPDGRLAFSSNRSGDYEIWVRDASGAETRVTRHAALDAGPAWSPDGRALIFHSTRSGRLQLWRTSVDGGVASLEQLTEHEGGARGASWWHAGEVSE
jgi:TolB protein